MYYVILDSTGNLVDSYDDEQEALAALERVVRTEPDAGEGLVLLTYDDEGQPVGQAVTIDGDGTLARPSPY